MVRQYIGARYVPKFFENPDGTCEWAGPTIGYEALTIVKYLGNSFTSKKTVPAQVDISDTRYWVNTGNFNAQLQEVSNDVEALSGDVSTLTDNVNTLTGDVESLSENVSNLDDAVNAISSLVQNSQRKYVFIGDSYNTAAHYGGWGANVITRLGLTLGTNAWNSGVPGASFGAGTFLSQLQSVASGMTADEKNSITDVVVVGSVNDWSKSASEIVNAVIDVENYVKTTFPNAREWIILAEWDYESDEVRNGVIQAYNLIQRANKTGIVINDMYGIFLNPYYLESDRVHPTQGGMDSLVIAICNSLTHGSTYIPMYTDLNCQVTTNDTLVIKGSINGTTVKAYTTGGFMQYGTPKTIGAEWDTTEIVGSISYNNLFCNSRPFNGKAMLYLSNSTFKVVDVLCRVVSNGNGTWTFKVIKTTIDAGESDYPVSGINAVRLFFDVDLAAWES